MNARAPFHIMTLIVGLPMLLVGTWGLMIGPLPFGFFFALLFTAALQTAQWQHDRWLAAEARGIGVAGPERRRRDRISEWLGSRPSPLAWIRRDRKRAMITGLWLLASALLLADLLFLGALTREYIGPTRKCCGAVRLSANAAMLLVALPILPAATALLLQTRWHQGVRRAAAAFGLALVVPALALAWLAGTIPGELGSLRLADGRRFVAVHRPFHRAALEQVEGPFGIYWHHLDYLAADGGRLIAAPDGQWLAFSQAGLFTQCFRVVPDRLIPCRRDAWAIPGDAERWSKTIAQVTGLRARPASEDGS